MLGVRGTGMFCTLIAFGAPVSISSYSMSRSMGSNYRLSGQAIAFSTVLCVFTLFFWIVFLLDKGLM